MQGQTRTIPIGPYPSLCALVLTALLAGPAPAQPTDGIASPNNDLVIRNGDLVIRDHANRVRTRLDSASGDWRSIDAGGRTRVRVDQGGANIFAGGNDSDQDGDIVLFSEGSPDQETRNASIHLDGGGAFIRLGGGGEHGKMVLRNDDAEQNILLDGENAHAVVGNAGHAGTLFMRNRGGDNTAVIEGATGQVRAGQVVSRHGSAGGSQGIDSASVYVASRDPALALHDTTGGNERGWYVQASSAGSLIFSTGTTQGLGGRVMVLGQDGSVCFGNCD